MMNRFIKYGLISITVITGGLIIGYVIFINTFNLFGEPEKSVTSTNCDYEGIRQATTCNFGGNAATVALISVSIDLGCGGYPDDENKKVIFSAEHRGGGVQTNWLSFDSLEVVYSKNLKPIIKIDQVTYPDSTLNLTVIYRTD